MTREQEVKIEFADVEIPRVNRQRDTLAAADPVPVGDQFTGSDGDAERADGEVGPAQAEGQEADDQRGHRTEHAGRDDADEHAGKILLIGEIGDAAAVRGSIFADIVNHADGNHRRDIHAGAVKEDIAERVVTHLPAGHVPGQRDDDHQPQRCELGAEIRHQERQDQGQPDCDVRKR